MPATLAQACVAVIGGDLRQVAVAEAIARSARQVRTYGLPGLPEDRGVSAASSLCEALAGAPVVVLPISGIGSNGRVNTLAGQPAVWLDEDFWRSLLPGTLILAGSLPDEYKQMAMAGGHRTIEYAEIDEIAILNSIPTAEGVLQLAMEGLPITIHGCCCFILGLGRTGFSSARLFKAVGADTWVVANRPALRARAYEMGCRALAFAELPGEIGRADLIVNSVPALVLPEQVLALTRPSIYIIDLASAPGGVDFRAAETLGRRAILAPGLPGKVAPESAGRILATALPAIIVRELSSGEEARQ